eukprot:TRINITY_DN2400_c0_g2_i1.p1 TRINITY_DN2400_c0_g2~~TRINITY_DN2400_c0_g2_i1.p1  ORF type:complete len:359 (+),score=101.58 TRINITY_DN2400_c0_g2_i1:110-1186(+)
MKEEEKIKSKAKTELAELEKGAEQVKQNFHLRHGNHEHLRSEPNFLPCFHPTEADFDHEKKDGTRISWNSRDHRKGRRPLLTLAHKDGSRIKAEDHRTSLLFPLSSVIQIFNISWWVAVGFTIGSSIWVANGFYIFLPIQNESIPYYEGAALWTAFAGGTVFQVASLLAIFEALGSQAEQVDENHHKKKKRPMRLKLNMRDLGTVAAFVQMAAATIFWISTITGLVRSIPQNPASGLTAAIYWTPQVVGGSGFVIASIILMLEIQKKWWKPALNRIGWWVAFWNLIGALGFLLCGAFGYASGPSESALYQSGLSTFWGAFAFLIGSIMQGYEAIQRDPHRKKKELEAKEANSSEVVSK